MKRNPSLPPSQNFSDAITLHGKVSIPEPAIWLACDLAFRGWRLSRHGGQLSVAKMPSGTPSGTERDNLTQTDRELITKWKEHLLVVVDYCESSIASQSTL